MKSPQSPSTRFMPAGANRASICVPPRRAPGRSGQAAWQGNRHLQNRVLREGDVFTLLVETNGPGAMYTELGRSCVLGKAPQELKDDFAIVLEARRLTLDR